LICKSFAKFVLILTLATLACGWASSSSGSIPAADSPTFAPTQETVVVPTVSIQSLTVEQLKNAQYQLGTSGDHTVVQLVNGKFQRGTDNTTLDYAQITLTDFVSLGDLTGDGINEAAAMVFENYGGTGDFGFLAIYTNVNGLPVFLTSIMIDDRPMINSITIKDNEVYLDATIHGSQDPGCCPALPTTRRYALVNNQLRLTNYTTAAPDGTKRIIEILSPANATESTGSVQVSGTVSIAPFENNLTYSIYDEKGNQLTVGAVPVTAADLGAPGTFNQLITLAGISAGTTIYLEVQDVSAADGSLLAMDAVKLLVK
jgi:hypothetical protein